MKKKFLIPCLLLSGFALWTILVCTVDVQPMGPMGSAVGLATVNRWFHALTGVHMGLYHLTDWLSILPLGTVLSFALMGLVQWMQRKSILRVDQDILALGGFYTAVMAAFVFFEICVINYRPVLIEGVPEASYPSSTTMLVLCVMLTARMQVHWRISNPVIRRILSTAIECFTVFMVVARAVSGVHWLTDILGGALLSAGLVMLYPAVRNLKVIQPCE